MTASWCLSSNETQNYKHSISQTCTLSLLLPPLSCTQSYLFFCQPAAGGCFPLTSDCLCGYYFTGHSFTLPLLWGLSDWTTLNSPLAALFFFCSVLFALSCLHFHYSCRTAKIMHKKQHSYPVVGFLYLQLCVPMLWIDKKEKCRWERRPNTPQHSPTRKTICFKMCKSHKTISENVLKFLFVCNGKW